MDEMAAQGKLTELRELAVMKIDDRERLVQALGVVYGTGGDGFPSYVSIKDAATIAVGYAAITGAEKLQLREYLVAGRFGVAASTRVVLIGFAASILAQEDEHRKALLTVLLTPPKQKETAETAEVNKDDFRQAIDQLVGKEGDCLHKHFIEPFSAQNLSVPVAVHRATMAELRTEEDRLYADAIIKQGPGVVPASWKEGPGWRSIKGFIQRVAVAQVHATAEDFTGKPVNKRILERAVDTSAWAVRRRMAAEAAGRAIATIAKTDRQNAGGGQRPDTRRDTRPDVKAPPGPPRTYLFNHPRAVNAGAPPAGLPANAAPGAPLPRPIKCHNCGQVGHLIASCQRPTKCYACQGEGHRSDQCPNAAKRHKKEDG